MRAPSTAAFRAQFRGPTSFSSALSSKPQVSNRLRRKFPMCPLFNLRPAALQFDAAVALGGSAGVAVDDCADGERVGFRVRVRPPSTFPTTDEKSPIEEPLRDLIGGNVTRKGGTVLTRGGTMGKLDASARNGGPFPPQCGWWQPGRPNWRCGPTAASQSPIGVQSVSTRLLPVVELHGRRVARAGQRFRVWSLTEPKKKMWPCVGGFASVLEYSKCRFSP